MAELHQLGTRVGADGCSRWSSNAPQASRQSSKAHRARRREQKARRTCRWGAEAPRTKQAEAQKAQPRKREHPRRETGLPSRGSHRRVRMYRTRQMCWFQNARASRVWAPLRCLTQTRQARTSERTRRNGHCRRETASKWRWIAAAGCPRPLRLAKTPQHIAIKASDGFVSTRVLRLVSFAAPASAPL